MGIDDMKKNKWTFPPLSPKSTGKFCVFMRILLVFCFLGVFLAQGAFVPFLFLGLSVFLKKPTEPTPCYVYI
jgi:hypothetical protein